ncbi:MAG: zinc-dependent alcohol dehydrogenase family protein [Intrasporangium sp.]|uniref:zinc-dependent alcohol dehydrogenase family protein n=1 Tax=Intrasporangium sp. TaxID=1925024 RepID=UPI0026470212|nr:zinc-dependent alcohol dehydrogenase family protein [Intrasporangium sp.]MDN5794494.1 zinc-dependent alcohol dehydrogenase family protein [Intrasporangium sp.]
MAQPTLPETMRAWQTVGTGAPDRIRPVTRPVPSPGPGEVLVTVEACGICRTDLHVTDGDLPEHRPHVVPGHEVVGTVARQGPDTWRFAPGDRVGIAWLRSTCGACRWCRSGRENLCPAAEFTGWDEDGGYAEHMIVPEAYAHRIPPELPAEQAAPLLCAGIIGYRALRRAALPPGGRLGLYGFGASAHLTAQLAIAQGAEVHVLTRGAQAQRLALELGAASVGPADAMPPVPLDSSILFAPAGELVPVALAGLQQGGTLALAGIHVSDIPPLSYQAHLFRERTVTSVTANTRRDAEEFLALAARLHIRASVTTYPFEAADEALDDLAHGRFAGVAVLSRAAAAR